MFTHRHLAITLAGVVFVATGSTRAGDRDLLDEVRDRQKVEAQRVEKEFAEDRLAAYKLVRSDSPKLAEATEKLHGLLAMIRNDTSLDSKRRAVLIVTLKADLDRVAQIASDRRRVSLRRDSDVARTIR